MGRKKQTPQFVLRIRNEGGDDLELRNVYQVLPDASATEEGYLWLIDESGEDHLYPADYFLPVALPAAVAEQLTVPVSSRRARARAADRGGTKMESHLAAAG